jgi:hypothetical protein
MKGPSKRLSDTQIIDMLDKLTSDPKIHGQMTSSISSSIAPEEARLAAILGTTKCRCLHVFTLDL